MFTTVSTNHSATHERILRDLTQHQHLHPHAALAETIRAICDRHALPFMVARRALEHAGLPAQQSSGRLSRNQVVHLASGIENAWQSHLSDRVRVA